jgi:hypothetical protein
VPVAAVAEIVIVSLIVVASSFVRVGLVSVLLVRVSVVARPTKVSVLVGRVNVPVLTMLEITGVVIVGLVAKTIAPEPVVAPDNPDTANHSFVSKSATNVAELYCVAML